MDNQVETYLTAALKRLETAYQEILKSEGLSQNSEVVKVLAEMVQEQVTHEDSRPSARPIG